MKYTDINVGRTSYKFQDFPSIHEFNQYLKDATQNSIFAHTRSSSQTDYSTTHFTGTKTIEEAQELLDTGWSVMAQRLSKQIPIKTTQAPAPKSKPTYSMVGGQASVPRYLQGVPTNMIDRKIIEQKQKIIVINKDASFNANSSAEAIESEGVKSLQLIQALENRGYRVKLNVHFLARSGSEVVAVRICLKQPGERLSLIKVAFPIAHPSMLRRIMFKWMETHPTMTSGGFCFGYGSACGNELRNFVPSTEYQIPNFITDIDRTIKIMGL